VKLIHKNEMVEELIESRQKNQWGPLDDAANKALQAHDVRDKIVDYMKN